MFVVFDMDGTLTNVEHRLKFLEQEPKDWYAFYEACDRDEEITPIIEAFRAMHRSGHAIEIWTGRRESVRSKTVAWLAARDLPDVKIRMRRDGDHRHDTVVKAEWLDEVTPDLVFEDRTSMVDFYRSRGIICAQVAPGDF